MIEGYFFYRALVVVFNTRTLSSIVYYVIGYGLPALTVIALALVNVITGVEMYLRRNAQEEVELCFLSVEAMPAIVAPAGQSQTLLFHHFVQYHLPSRPGLCSQPCRHHQGSLYCIQGWETKVN